MAGGVGERFWPRSRRRKPKQLLDLTGEGTMISLTVGRLKKLSRPDEVFVITVADQKAEVVEELEGAVPAENIVAEPVGRNTAATVGLAAVIVRARFGDEPFVMLPADHLVGDRKRFEAALSAADEYVRHNDSLLTFGVRPTRPETGYGYIQAGTRLGSAGGEEILAVERFCEKPSVEDARRFIEAGSYYWNSGMFCWRTSVILGAIATHLPELHKVLMSIERGMGTGGIDVVLNDVYGRAPRVSIDYGVMEKADNVAVLPSDFAWNDVGSWESVREIYGADAEGNVLVGDHEVIDSSNTTIFSPERTVGVIGLNDVVIVGSDDAILVCARDEVQKVRKLVETLKNKGREKLL